MITKKRNKCANKHALGDILNKIGGNIGNLNSGGMGVLNGVAGVGSNVLSSLINPSGVSTGVGTALQGIGSLASNIPGVGGLVGAGVGLLGGLGNAMFGSKLNNEFINQTESAIKNQERFNSSATTTDQLLSDWGSLTNLANVSKSQVGKDGWFSNKAKNKTRELNKDIEEANERALLNLSNVARNVEQIGDANILSNFMSRGGKIGKIKPSKRGTFKAQATKMGMGVQEAARHILAHKDEYSPTMRKKAAFAKATSKWKHADGGFMDYEDDIVLIDEGGTHENNPYEGVQVGVDPQGIPNLVEEGEVIYKDYVFSNRIKVPKEMKRKYKFRGETFSDVARNIQKEIKEKPNDPLTRNSTEAAMSRLTVSQETQRKGRKDGKNKYAKGGYSMGLEERDLNESDLNWVTSLFGPSKSPVTTETKTGTSVPKTNKRATWGRYAPILGSLAATITDAVEKPDYSSVDAIVEAGIPRKSVAFSPVGTKISFDPFDRGYYINQLNASNAATRRAITENSGGNRAAALAGLLASDFNYSRQLGDVGRRADEYNNTLKERAASFNRQTDMFNSEGAMKAAMANKSDDEMRFRAGTTAAQMREAIRNNELQRRSSNISGFLQQLGDLGAEAEQRNWLDNLAQRGVLRMDTTGKVYSKGGKRR